MFFIYDSRVYNQKTLKNQPFNFLKYTNPKWIKYQYKVPFPTSQKSFAILLTIIFT